MEFLFFSIVAIASHGVWFLGGCILSSFREVFNKRIAIRDSVLQRVMALLLAGMVLLVYW